jgi:uncharacterized surface protein with fasciclin (FAS1) repeats
VLKFAKKTYLKNIYRGILFNLCNKKLNKMKNVKLILLGLLLSPTLLSAQTNVFDDIIATSPNHTALKAALEQTNLDDALRNPDATLTVFAPTDEAFNDAATALGTDLNGILALPNLADILLYHVLGSNVPSSAVTNGAIVSPLSTSNTLKLTRTAQNEVFVNQASVTLADVNADNGVVHVLNGVVLPVTTVVDVAINNDFTALTQAVVTAELLPALSNPFANFTVFAPTDEAFNDAATALGTDLNGILALPNLADILLYHVLGSNVPSSAVTNGAIVSPLSTSNTLKLTRTAQNEVFVNQASVTLADVNADNGVVHVLNGVILPVTTVVDVAINNDFTALTQAVVTAELLPALSNPFANFTVFAPTDEAFNDAATALGTDLNGILALPNLADILLYHVLGSNVPSSAVTNGAIVSPLSTSNTLKLTRTAQNEVFVNQASVTLADVNAHNGVVHVLNGVVLPVTTVVDVAINNDFTALTQAVVTAELLPALSNPFANFTVFAPTDEAFNDAATALGTDLNGILALPNLADILLYHMYFHQN